MKVGLADLPSEPKVPLPNYLLNLIDEKDSKEKSIYLINVEGFIKEIWEDIKKVKKRPSIRKLISEKLEISVDFFYKCKNGKKKISITLLFKLLQLWKVICHKTEKELERKWNEIFKSEIRFCTHGRTQKTKLPKYITPKLCYFVGWIVGDGSLSQQHGFYSIKISEKNKHQLDLVLKPLIKDLFGINVPIFRADGRGHRIQFGNKIVHRFLTKILKIKVGKIPSFIKKLDITNKKYFLRGIFDSEGYVSKNRNRLTISQANLSFLKELIKMLKEMDIFPNGPIIHRSKRGIWYSTKIDNKKEFIKFSKKISSSHVEKFKLIQMRVMKIENRNSGSSATLG